MTRAEFIPLPGYREYPASEMAERAAAVYHEMNRRRTVRDFAAKPVPTGVIEECLRAAGTAPSGANMQPWHMVVVTDPAIKQRSRTDAEVEEREFYEHRAPTRWRRSAPTTASRFSRRRRA